MSSNFLYGSVKYFLKVVTSMYFQKINVIGQENIPKEGPVIICGNHANQFVDPMLIISNSTRNLSVCMAASSYSKPVIGYFAKKLAVIPVYRPEDGKIKAKGKIKMVSKTKIEGIGTTFLEDTKDTTKFPLGLQSLMIKGKYMVYVSSIDSDTSITIKENEAVFETLSKEEEEEFFYFYIPKMDNSKMFTEAYQILKNNGSVCIFPEGTSHDRTNFIKLKAGVALMALGAMAHHDTQEIKIMSAGLSYFRREEFRSQVLLEFGTPFTIPKEWGELFKTDKKAAIEKTLKEIELRMKAVTITAPSFKESLCLGMCRSLYIPKDKQLPPEKYSELCKRFSKAYEEIRDRKDTKSLKRKIIRYMDELDNAGLDDAEVKTIDYSYGFFVRKTIISFILFHVFLLFALPMIGITAPFLWIVKKKAEKERIAAKAKNPNKIQALDVVSSVKITNFLKYLPLMFILWIIFMLFFINHYLAHLTGHTMSIYSIIVLSSAIFPLYCYLSTLTVDRLFFYLDTMKTRFLFFCYPKNVYRLKDTRSKLEAEVDDFVNNYVKDNEELAKDRIIIPYGEAENLKRRDHAEEKKNAKELEQFLIEHNLK